MFSKRKYVIVAVMVLSFVGLAAGCDKQTESASNSSANTANTNNSQSSMAKENHGSSDLQSSLTALFGQHVDLAAAATRAGFDGRTADFNASAKSLDNNSVAISKAIGSAYGADAEANFLAVWRSHIGFFVDYTTAAKAGDKAKMDTAVTNLMGYVEASAQFLSDANPNLPKAALKEMITEHVLQLKGAVDAYGAGDVAKSYSEQEVAYAHMGELAHTLADAITKQFPDKF